MGQVLQKILAFLVSIWLGFQGTSYSKLDYSDKLGQDYTGLCEVYEDYFNVGTSTSAWEVNTYTDFITKNYNCFTEWEGGRPNKFNPSKGVYNTSELDALANFCRQHGCKMRWHMLCWQILEQDWWMTHNDDGSITDKDTYLARMREYIKFIRDRYDDVIYTYDVVNEPFGYDTLNGEFKSGILVDIFGSAESYITEMFKLAREVLGPDAVLCLNETKVVNNDAKFRYMKKYLQKWLKEGVPIDAVGIQGHFEVLTIKETGKRLGQRINAFADMGLDCQITELNFYTVHDSDPFEYVTIPKHILALQTKKVKDVFEALRENKDKVSSITFWGSNDGCGGDPEKGVTYRNKAAHPTLFDLDKSPKQAYWAAVDF